MKSGLASGLNAQAEYVLELQYHTQRNYGAGNVAVEGSVIEAFTDMAPSVALAALGRQMLLDELAHVGESSQCRDGRFSTAGAGGAISSDGATRGSSRTQYRSEIGRRISYPSERDPIHRGLRSGLPPAHIPSWCRRAVGLAESLETCSLTISGAQADATV